MWNTHCFRLYTKAQTHTHTHRHKYTSGNKLFLWSVFSFFFFSCWDTHSCRRPTLRQKSQFKHIKSTADYVCRYYPKNQRCAFSKETQTITDLITPELYRSRCSVFTLSDMAETTAQIRTERRFSSQLS